MPNAVVLLSGGLDSATILAVAKSQGYNPFSLSVDYGQRHAIELKRAQQIADAFGVAQHKCIRVDLRTIGGSALTDDIDVPKNRDAHAIGHGIPATYVPARNTIFLSLALGYAETVNAFDLFIGANVYDYSGYPDCRPEYLDAFERMANLATKTAIEGEGRYRIHAPLIRLTKAEIIRTGIRLGVDYHLTSSCYDPADDGKACGKCDSCSLRKKGFAEAGLPDPTEYRNG